MVAEKSQLVPIFPLLSVTPSQLVACGAHDPLPRNRGGKSGGQFLPQRTQSGGLFSHKRTEPVFLLRGRRLSDARTKMLSLDAPLDPRAEAT